MTEREYGRLVKEMSPASPMGKDCLIAFVVGGLICTLGQVFINCYTQLGLEKEMAGTAASMTDDFASLDVASLQKVLRDNGVRLHEEDI